MSTQTQHIGLHQWERADPFLREDFNQDHRLIDAAVAQAEGKADQALSGLEDVGYNVYNLLLQNYYEGKYTGFKKGLMFDGFLDGSRIASWEGSAYRDTAAHTVSLDTAGQSDVPRPATLTSGKSARRGDFVSRLWTAQGNGTITAVSVQGYGTSNIQTVALSIWQDDRKLADATKTLDFLKDNMAWYEFPITCSIRKDEVYEIRVENVTSEGIAGSIVCAYEDEDSIIHPVAIGLTVTPAGSTSGGLISSAEDIGPWTQAICYVRHSGGGTVAAFLGEQSGSLEKMEQAGTSAAQTLEGTSCQESTFRLTRSAAAAAGCLRLSLSGSTPVVHDYGVIFLE
ncbi:hypothetical protein [uncultured Pseudoflavonifractor sp.]|uniref:hypothetical protein n=1 Tax=uncultured Pseudoflavonifractor sp. TaxID=1221379 RepID=UPI0025CD2CF1|nr:hypothetical protein [uncultured Pseudoflavonifractor sp.]